jgi:hypothetical protein
MCELPADEAEGDDGAAGRDRRLRDARATTGNERCEDDREEPRDPEDRERDPERIAEAAVLAHGAAAAARAVAEYGRMPHVVDEEHAARGEREEAEEDAEPERESLGS